MNTDNTTHSLNAGWQVLGELELSVGTSVEDTLTTWLTELLLPISLQSDLLNKIIISAQEAVTRAMHSDGWTSIGHIHLSVFAPNEFNAQGNTWGFFRIEKIDNPESNNSHPNHIVELYLYQERQ